MKKLLLPIVILALAGCATQVPYQHNNNYSLIDPRAVNMEQYDSDYKDCASLANQTDVQKGATTGVLAGAALGGFFGAVIGGSDGARMGAALGSGQGLVQGGVSAKREQDNTLRACLAGRGYRVIR